ncbi:MAG TPA: serine hydrolase domain-containing protein [Streptosporangiaceae bacterium]
MPHTSAIAHWADRLGVLAGQARVSGAALGIWADGQETVVAHGVLSAATGVTVTPDTLFQIGSITKPWTATMIMQLIEEGRLSLDTTVEQLLPGLRLGAGDVGSRVTVRHLLTHTSGIDGDIFTDTGRGADCLERYVAGLADATQVCPVGQVYSYCNSGFVLLGRIIEVLDGREWDESLRKRLIEPLGLTRTVTLPEEAIMHRAAVGHRARPHEPEPVPSWMLARSLGPAGLITACAHDVLEFARTHLAGGVAPAGARLLAEDTALAMRQPQFPIPGAGPGAQSVGLAWRIFDWAGRAVFGHDGSTVGQSAYLRIDPRSGVVACLLTNAAQADALYHRVFSEVLGEYAGITIPAGPEPTTGTAGKDGPADAGGLDLGRHAGRYERTSRRFDVFVRDGQLHGVVTVTGELAAVRAAEDEEVVLLPSDTTGNNFVCRSSDDDPWTAVSFGTLADQTPYLYMGGRITLRTG